MPTSLLVGILVYIAICVVAFWPRKRGGHEGAGVAHTPASAPKGREGGSADAAPGQRRGARPARPPYDHDQDDMPLWARRTLADIWTLP